MELLRKAIGKTILKAIYIDSSVIIRGAGNYNLTPVLYTSRLLRDIMHRQRKTERERERQREREGEKDGDTVRKRDSDGERQ